MLSKLIQLFPYQQGWRERVGMNAQEWDEEQMCVCVCEREREIGRNSYPILLLLKSCMHWKAHKLCWLERAHANVSIRKTLSHTRTHTHAHIRTNQVLTIPSWLENVESNQFPRNMQCGRTKPIAPAASLCNISHLPRSVALSFSIRKKRAHAIVRVVCVCVCVWERESGL